MAVTQSTFCVVKLSAQGDELTGLVDVNFLYWFSKGANADDELKVCDSDGNILWEDTADGANYCNFCPLKIGRVNGVKATTMESGYLYVYKEAEIPGQF